MYHFGWRYFRACCFVFVICFCIWFRSKQMIKSTANCSFFFRSFFYSLKLFLFYDWILFSDELVCIFVRRKKTWLIKISLIVIPNGSMLFTGNIHSFHVTGHKFSVDFCITFFLLPGSLSLEINESTNQTNT